MGTYILTVHVEQYGVKQDCMTPILHYISDPMCSWCYAFEEPLQQLVAQFQDHLELEFHLCGLAFDSDEPMDLSTKAYIQEQWKAIESRTELKFNWDFWKKCKPRRSTYNSCRAVIAARQLDSKLTHAMFTKIQELYYQRAMNPSDYETLELGASEIGLDVKKFRTCFESEQTESFLQEDVDLQRRLGFPPFPSLYLETEEMWIQISWGFEGFEAIHMKLKEALGLSF